MKSITFTNPLTIETLIPSDLIKALRSASKSREIPDPLNLSVWALINAPNPPKRYFKLLYFNSRALKSAAPRSRPSKSDLVTPGFSSFKITPLSLRISASKSASL